MRSQQEVEKALEDLKIRYDNTTDGIISASIGSRITALLWILDREGELNAD